MASESYLRGLMETVTRGYRQEKQLYEQQESYSRAAYNSGGSEETRYKSMRNEVSRQRDALRAEIERAEQELLRAGYYTEVAGDRVNFPRR